jgi:hypothetical protein
MTKPLLYLPRGSYDPNRFVKVNPVERRDDIQVIGAPGLHKEKALAVLAQVAGRPVIIAGGGEEWTEDQKDMVERMREEETALANQRAQESAERAKTVQEDWLKHFEMKIERHRRNHRTAPDPKHVIPKEKRFW